MDKRIASQVLSTLDSTAKEVEELLAGGHVNSEEAGKLLHNIDSFADRLQIAAYGKASFRAFQAKVLERDSDEPWMDTFNNVQEPIQTDPDEPYMHMAPGGYNSKDMPTYDSDDSSGVTERDEYAVHDLSEYSDPTKQQPSWARGPAGKSTKQGSGKPKIAAKTWAP